jgi:hypothetical protein
MNWCASWKLNNGAENLVLKVLQFKEMGVCHKFPDVAFVRRY